MAIENSDEEQFKAVLRANLTPARAISDPQHLRGREALLRQIDWAFNSPGKHVFVFGERGVGKTSLAQSAATLHQSSDAKPIQIACDEYADFGKMIADIARRALPPRDVIEKMQTKTKSRASVFGFSAELEQGIARGVIPPIESLNDAIVLLQYIANLHSKEPILIIDEFDQVGTTENRKRFADLIKQISDQEVPLRLIFCGIGSTLEELIGVHLSTDRYLSPVEVPRLSHDALWQILNATALELGVEVGHEDNVRISRISDGFPYYVHLIGEHMFRSMFYDDCVVQRVSLEHFHEGVTGAISEAMASLRLAYELAIQKHVDEYEEVLWSVADENIDARKTRDIYEDSYIPIMTLRNEKLAETGNAERKIIKRTTFYQRMNALKRESHGRILVGSKQGWYGFRENWMRGYVRLRAEQAGVELGIDHHFAEKPAHRQANWNA